MSHPLIESADPDKAQRSHANAPLLVRKASAFLVSSDLQSASRLNRAAIAVCLALVGLSLGMLGYNLWVGPFYIHNLGLGLPTGVGFAGFVVLLIGSGFTTQAIYAAREAASLIKTWEHAQAALPQTPGPVASPVDTLIEQIVSRSDPAVAAAARQAGSRASALRSERAALAAMIADRPDTANTLNPSLARIDADLAEIDAQLAALYAGLAALDAGNPPALEDAGHRVAADLEVARKLESARRAEKLER